MRLTVPEVPALLAGALLLAGPAAAQTRAQPSAESRIESPRFTMLPVEDGLMKLDTHTGTLSFCSMRSDAWVCEAVPEDRAALEAEIGRLHARIAALEKGGAGGGTGGVPDIMAPPEAARPGEPPAASPPVTPPPAADEDRLPPEAEKRLDQAMDMAERVFRRFFEMVDRLRGDPPAQGQSL
ncbi:hypothetical protein MWN33_04570 [Starkeya koreensis]|uniref:Uncharacterized protein n=1 Tax=Ancylobacter koreensis TaxID=266121 RepID=A0ABT0DJE7_9HYPH|nr:hypothetical protein [Ancylobacter koreensis]MCK0207304.1 hypothetical protein [Ancylobacter koreensis]